MEDNHSKINGFQKHPRITIITFVLCFYLIVDLALGLIFQNLDYNSFRVRHFYYHHGLLPNQTAFASWSGISYPMFTNSVSCRDKEVRTIKPYSSEKRILFIGDSHTEGVGLPYNETFAGILQNRLENTGKEILNASAVSYSPKIYFLRTKYLLDIQKIHVNEVFVFIDISDLQNELVYENFTPSEPGVWKLCWFKINTIIMRHSFTAKQIKRLRERIELYRFMKRAAIFDSYRTTGIRYTDALSLYAGFFSSFDDKILLSNPKFHGVGEWIYDPEFRKLAEKGLKLGQENILRLSELCRQKNIPLTLSVHPWQEQIAHRDTSDMYVESWRKFCNINKIRFINLYPAFIYPKTSLVFGNDFFLPNDNHWNKAGNLIVADELMKYMPQ